MINFSDWLKQRESSAYTRARTQYALGLGPAITMFSRSTPNPGELEKVEDKEKPKKKKKKKKKKYKESKELNPDHSIDKWLQSVDSLKRDLDSIDKEKPEDEEEDEEDDLEDDSDVDTDVDDSESEDDFGLDAADDDESEDDDEIAQQLKNKFNFNLAKNNKLKGSNGFDEDI